MSRLTCGPMTEFFSAKLATIFGASGSARSTISTESHSGPIVEGARCSVPPFEQFASPHRLRVIAVSDFEPPRALCVRVIHPLRDNTFEIERPHSIE